MSRTSIVRLGSVALISVLLLPAVAWAQQTSGIAGVVKDTSGAVLPGVTVETTSPALIERVRSGVTDGQGQYKIVDLRPGSYVVTFVLPGFSNVRREGIVLTAGFTATVNADLQVGTVQETVTVSGEAPFVDAQNVRRQNVVSNELLTTLPTSTKHVNTLVVLTPGLSAGDGRSLSVSGEYSTQVGGAFHGKGGTKTQFDGMGVQNMSGDGNTGYILNSALVQEMTLQTSGISAESNADGPLVNLIPKEGANTFSGTISGLHTNDKLQSDNLTDELRKRGLSTVDKTLKIYDAGLTFGGRIKRDRLWFFTSQREWGNGNQNAGVFWNKTQGTPFYTPDPDRPADRYQWYESHAVRLTWQASQRHKLNVLADVQDVCVCRSGSGVGQPPESALAYHFRPGGLYQAVWNAPVTNRLLLEAGTSATINHWPQYRQPGVSPDDISILDTGTGLRYNARTTYDDPNPQDRYAQRFSVSYITGSHAFKSGFQVEEGIRDSYTVANGHDVSYTFLNGVPNRVTQYATPYLEKDRIKADLGLYGQDQWTIKRLTLNLGARFDYFNAYVPEQNLPAGRFVPARSFAPVYNVPLWKDINPRLGAAYDLFGDGRTALKVSLGRYVAKAAVDITSANNPIITSVNSVNRAWTDVNNNYVPDCDLSNPAANGECGPFQDQAFGKVKITTRWADDVIHGWGVRPYNWDLSTEVQHQLGAGISLTAGYYRNWYGNFRVTDNLAVTPGDFSPYCMTAPRDSRLPGGGAYQVCGLYDINPDKFGNVENLVTQASHYGKQRRVSNFFNVSLNTRFASSIQLGGGVDAGRTVDDACFNVDSPGAVVTTASGASTLPGVANVPGVTTNPIIPFSSTTVNGERICRVVTPFAGTAQLKVFGSYRLPADFVVSGIYQNLPGAAYIADYSAGLAEIVPSLGRNLAGGARSATVPLLAPQTQFENRLTRLDLRLSKMVRVRQVRVQGNADIYNVLNASSLFQVSNTFGPRWRLPSRLLEARIVQFSAQLTF